MSWLWVLAIALAFLLVPGVLGPIAVHRGLRVPPRPRVRAVQPLSHSIPEGVARHLAASVSAMQPLGFESAGRFQVPNLTGKVQGFLVVFVNRAEKDTAQASGLVATAPLRRRPPLYLEFATRFKDGGSVITTNSDRLQPFPPRPDSTVAQLPSVSDAATLSRVHRMLVARHGAGREKALRLGEESAGDTAAAVAGLLAEEHERHAAAGMLRLSPGGGAYRPTWKGAFLMTWRQIWPIRALRRAALRRRERSLLSEVGATPAENQASSASS